MTSAHTGRLVIRDTHLVSMDEAVGERPHTDVLVVDGRIAEIGSGLSVADAEEIDGSGRILLPGFVDTHRHTWQSLVRHLATDWTLGQYFTGIHFGLSKLYRPEDTEIANLLGALEALDAGVTTMLDWSHNLETPAHADGAIAGLRDSGIRAVFAHGGGATMWAVPNEVPHTRDIERIQREYFGGGDSAGLLTLAFAARGPQFTPGQTALDDFRLARELGLRVTVHVGDGEWGRIGPVRILDEHGLADDRVTYVHCNTLTDDELAIIARTGGTASVAADIESQMGHGWPATGRLLAAGIRPSLSIDVCSSTSGDMFGAMKSTIALQRALDNAATENADAQVGVKLRCADVLEFATKRGAIANGLGDRVGSVTVGKEADLVLLNATGLGMTPLNNAVGAVVYSGSVGLVDTVLVGGTVVKRDGRLVRGDLEAVKARANAARDELFERAERTAGTEQARTGGAWMPGALSAS
jgi:5-methylthioadenosine/S-adenosylhomocysteine deaminase